MRLLSFKLHSQVSIFYQFGYLLMELYHLVNSHSIKFIFGQISIRPKPHSANIPFCQIPNRPVSYLVKFSFSQNSIQQSSNLVKIALGQITIPSTSHSVKFFFFIVRPTYLTRVLLLWGDVIYANFVMDKDKLIELMHHTKTA